MDPVTIGALITAAGGLLVGVLGRRTGREQAAAAQTQAGAAQEHAAAESWAALVSSLERRVAALEEDSSRRYRLATEHATWDRERAAELRALGRDVPPVPPLD